MKRTGAWMLVLTGWLAIAPQVSTAVDVHEGASRSVKAAFREVVARPANSTVQVYCEGKTSALGTIVDASGYVVTKASELKGAITCQLNTGSTKYDATIVGRDAALDLALLKIDAKELQAIAWTDEAPPVGSWLATPGLSRDPLALGVLSVSPRKIKPPAGALGIDLGGRSAPATIREIVPNSAADEAGLRGGDVILKVDGKAMPSSEVLIETISSRLPGDTVELLIKRGTEELTIKATLRSRVETFSSGDDRAEFQNNLGSQLSERRAGFPLVIQHDSILKPSECGGPLVDLDGKAVGINIARAGRVESYALPGSIVREAVKKILDTQHQTAAGVER
jgi:serine protease Do